MKLNYIESVLLCTEWADGDFIAIGCPRVGTTGFVVEYDYRIRSDPKLPISGFRIIGNHGHRFFDREVEARTFYNDRTAMLHKSKLKEKSDEKASA
jgi:hypothetical protein